MDQVDEVKKKTDIAALISEVVQLKKAGRNYKGLCPFHSEKSPSFMVSPEIQIFKCFGCGLGGDVLRFVMEQEKVEFPQALKILADRAGVTLKPLKGFSSYAEKDEIYNINFIAGEFYHYILTIHPLGQKARDYLEKRGIKREAIVEFKLGFSPDNPEALLNFLTKKRGYKLDLLEKAGIIIKSLRGSFDRFRGRIIFPLKDHFGNTLGFAGRVLEAKGDLAKYINSPETLVYKKGQVLYGLELSKNEIKTKGFVVIVEGELDCISSWQAEIKNIVAIKGSALTQEQAQLLARFTSKVILALDADFAGDAAARRGLDILVNAGLTVQIASLGEYKDPDEMAQKEPEKLKEAIVTAEGMYDFLINSTIKRYGVETTESKAKISRELTPILSSIEDEIVRAHCIKQVSVRLDVPEEAVAAQIRKSGQVTFQKRQVFEKKDEESGSKNRRDVLEDYLLAHIFQTASNIHDAEKLKDLIKTPVRKKLLDLYLSQEGSFDPIAFTDRLPPEMVEIFSNLLLIEVKTENLEKIEDEEKRLIKELKMVNLRERILSLSQEVQRKTNEENTPEIEQMQRELSTLGQELSVLEGEMV